MVGKMLRINRRNLLGAGLALMVFVGVTIVNPGRAAEQDIRTSNTIADKHHAVKGDPIKIHYLEIVTPEVDAACGLYSQMHGVTFGKAEQNLGGARVANLAGGGMLGIRAPLRDTEK